MKSETFESLMALVVDDPLTPAQMSQMGLLADDRLVGVSEASRLLDVSPQTMRRIGLPVVKVGRRVLYRTRDLHTYIKRHTYHESHE